MDIHLFGFLFIDNFLRTRMENHVTLFQKRERKIEIAPS